MSTRSSKVVAAFAILLFATATPASAAILEGQTVKSLADSYGFRGQYRVHAVENSIIGPGVELPTFGDPSFLSVDFSDSTILITSSIDQFVRSAAITLHFIDANLTIPRFTAVTVNPATNWEEFGADRVAVAPNEISLYLPNGRGLTGQQILLEISALAPEPAAISLAGIGAFAAVGLSRRRRAGRPRRHCVAATVRWNDV
jgi:hypothetical protein